MNLFLDKFCLVDLFAHYLPVLFFLFNLPEGMCTNYRVTEGERESISFGDSHTAIFFLLFLHPVRVLGRHTLASGLFFKLGSGLEPCGWPYEIWLSLTTKL